MSGEVSRGFSLGIARRKSRSGSKARSRQFLQRPVFHSASHLRGSAGAIEAFNNGQNEPQTKPSLLFVSQAITTGAWWQASCTSTKKGVVSAWHTCLHIADVPVLYVPYYRFPIGDQRMTGFF